MKSSTRILSLIICSILFSAISQAQLLDVDGGILISDSDSTKAGLIKWTGTDFEGYDGSNWKSLTDTGLITYLTDSVFVFKYDSTYAYTYDTVYTQDTTYAFLNDSLTFIVDADGNTHIIVDDGADNNEINFTVEGDELLSILKNTNGQYRFHMETGPGSNLYVGSNAGKTSNTGILGRNTAIGHSSMRSITSGYQNVAIGYAAMSDATTSFANIAIGEDVLRDGDANNDNIVLGNNTYLKLENSSNNIAIGNNIALQDTAGSNNVFIGQSVAYSSGVGAEKSENVIIGSRAGSSSTGSGNVFIGYRAGANDSGDDKLIIENSNSSDPLIYGDFANDSLNVHGHLTSDYSHVGQEMTGRKGKLVVSQGNTHAEPAVRLMEHGTAGSRIYFQDSSSSEVIGIHGHSVTGKLRFYFHDEATASAGPKATFQANGRAAINGDNPQHTLHVFGSIKAEDTIIIQPKLVPPALLIIGTMWYDSGSNRLRVWDGGLWQPCW